jgi:hypothetical protein
MTDAIEQRVKADLLLMCNQTPKVVKGYVPHRTLEMLRSKGGLATLEWMLEAPCEGEGFLKMAADAILSKGHTGSIHPLSLTMESYVVSNPDVQKSLGISIETINLIRERLIDLGFDPATLNN